MQQEERKNQRADAEADLRASRHASPPRTCCRLLKCGASGKSAATNRSGRCAPRYFPATGTGMIAPHDLQSESAAVRPALRATRRTEERRVGNECVRTCRSRWQPYHKKKTKTRINMDVDISRSKTQN